MDLRGFVDGLKEIGYQGFLSYEICGPVVGGGKEENLDRYAKKALAHMRELVA